MKIAFCLAAVLAAAALFPVPARSQDEAGLPRQPAVANRPAIGQYTVAHSYATPLPQWTPERMAEIPKRHHPRRLEKTEGASDGKTRREIRTWSDGVVTECWAFAGTTLYQNPSLLPDDIQIFGAGGPVVGGGDIPATFPELAWVSETNYVKRSGYKGKPADHYVSALHPKGSGVPGESPLPAVEVEAWIDPATRLPIASRQGNEKREYRFQAGAPATLTPPRLFLEFLEKLRKLRSKPPGDV